MRSGGLAGWWQADEACLRRAEAQATLERFAQASSARYHAMIHMTGNTFLGGGRRCSWPLGGRFSHLPGLAGRLQLSARAFFDTAQDVETIDSVEPNSRCA